MGESPNIPTVILVHGGFADASFWVPVIKELHAHNVPVLAPPNPLRGLAHDAEYTASYVNQVDGRCFWSVIPTVARSSRSRGQARPTRLGWSTSQRSRSTKANPSRTSSASSALHRLSRRCNR